MSAAQFDIVFRGVRDGFDPAQVKAQFAILFKLHPARVDRIFSAKHVTLKTNVDAELAGKYVKRLAAIGVIVDQIAIIHTPSIINPLSIDTPSVVADDSFVSKAIYIADAGIESTDCAAMHQAVDFPYGEQIRRIPFEFTGNAFEYCKLWLVNVLVCVLSAGILYPWAKVRSLRYFYQHTNLDGAEFNYTSSLPKVFIIQFILVAYLFNLAYSFFYMPVYFGIGLVMLLGLLPFYWLKLTQFKMLYSSYRDIELQHIASIKDTYVVMLFWPLVFVVTAGIAAPLVVFKIQKHLAQSKLFGQYNFTFLANPKKYLGLLPSLLFAELITAVLFFCHTYISIWLTVLMLAGAWVMVCIRWRVLLMNIFWNSVSNRFGYFTANWRLEEYQKLIFKNTILCILTFGLYWPWAKIHNAKYKAQHLAFFANQRFGKWQRSFE